MSQDISGWLAPFATSCYFLRMDKDRVAPALGKVASGLYIGTCTEDGSPIGMLSSFVGQVGFAPPMVTVAIAPERRLAKALEASGKLGLNILGNIGSGDLMKPFFGSDGDPFKGLSLVENPHGVPQLSDALAFLACELRDKLPAGDHTVYLCEVIDGVMPEREEKDEPMVRIRPNGLKY